MLLNILMKLTISNTIVSVLAAVYICVSNGMFLMSTIQLQQHSSKMGIGTLPHSLFLNPHLFQGNRLFSVHHLPWSCPWGHVPCDSPDRLAHNLTFSLCSIIHTQRMEFQWKRKADRLLSFDVLSSFNQKTQESFKDIHFKKSKRPKALFLPASFKYLLFPSLIIIECCFEGNESLYLFSPFPSSLSPPST